MINDDRRRLGARASRPVAVVPPPLAMTAENTSSYSGRASVQEIEPMPHSGPTFLLALGFCAVALAPVAFAQNPTSNKASNIGAADTASPIAPALPSPDLGPGAPPLAFLHAARAALATGRTGEAQQALEMAETRLLDRSTPLFQTNDPSTQPADPPDRRCPPRAGQRRPRPVDAAARQGHRAGRADPAGAVTRPAQEPALLENCTSTDMPRKASAGPV